MSHQLTVEERRRSLELKYGEELFRVYDTDVIPRDAIIPYYAGLDKMLATDEALSFVDKKLETSYQLARKRSGKHFAKLSRRNFLMVAGVVVAAVATPLGNVSMAMGSKPEVPPNPNTGDGESGGDVTPPDPTTEIGFEDFYPTGPPETDIDQFYVDSADRSLVGMAQMTDVGEMVRKAIELAGGLGEILPGQTVCIKPNNVIQMLDFTNLYHKVPTCTNPEVLRHVIRAVVERTGTVNTVFVSERAALGSPTLLQMMFSGIYDVAMEEGVHILPWENKGYTPFTHWKCRYLKQAFKVPESIRTFDHFINVPVMKNHEMVFDQVEFTAGIKAFVGLLHPNERMGFKHQLHEKDFCEKVVELNLCRPYSTMTIIDATEVVLIGGPAYPWMKYATPGIVVAGKDRVATDAMGLAVLKRHAMLAHIKRNYVRKTIWEQRQIRYATELGFGYGDPDRIDIAHHGIADMDAIMQIWNET